MKKFLALSALIMVMGLSFGTTPSLAVSCGTAVTSETSAATVNAITKALALAQAALNATAPMANPGATNAKEVAAMRNYLQKLMTQAQTLNWGSLSTAQAQELAAALEEGAHGLRMTAGVNRTSSSATTVNSSSNTTTSSNPTAKNSRESEASLASTKVSVTVVSSEEALAETMAEKTVTTKSNTTSETQAAEAKTANEAQTAEAKTTSVKAETMNLANAVTSTEVEQAGTTDNEDAVEVPKAGISDEDQATSAVHWIGLVLGGAAILAAASSILIVKRMKRGL